jgi:hypothetical protein
MQAWKACSTRLLPPNLMAVSESFNIGEGSFGRGESDHEDWKP